MKSNRDSARRARLKRLARQDELEREVSTQRVAFLATECGILKRNLCRVQIAALKNDKEKLLDKVESLSVQLEATTKEKLELQEKATHLQEQLVEKAKELTQENDKEKQKATVDEKEETHTNAIIHDEDD